MENKIQKYSEFLNEGTWSLPKNQHEIDMCIKMMKQIHEMKDKLYNICGDDILFDGLDKAESRIKELINIK